MGSMFELFPEKYYEEAKKMLKKKDFVDFVSNISIAVETSRNSKEMLAKTTYLRVKGLITFNQYSKAINSIEEALQYNFGAEAFELKKNKGVAKGFLGDVSKALKIFKELVTETEEINLLVGAYINIAWVHLTLNKSNSEERDLEEAKYYLDLVNEHFDILSNRLKWKILNNYSVYYFYKEEYEKAIEMLEDSIQYCEEIDLPEICNNLAELYLKSDEDAVCEKVNEYLKKAETLGTKYNNNLALGKAFYTNAMVNLREEQIYSALDNLNVSFEYFQDAEAQVYSLECVVKINEIMNNYKLDCLKSMKKRLEGIS
ncbi:MAG: hypothetical protein KAX49_09990 [Halanaerobiales bacterium]|nr:hypothetical protein [Halanaerobiales bacterium]